MKRGTKVSKQIGFIETRGELMDFFSAAEGWVLIKWDNGTRERCHVSEFTVLKDQDHGE